MRKRETTVTPPLKWAGGKRWLTARHASLLPEFDGRYIEPFFGGGAVFFYLRPTQAVLSDLNRDLIETYRGIKSSWAEVTALLQQHAINHSSQYYYETRQSKPTSGSELAAWFLYMNRACYNGLYRVNRRGEFNVPKGTKDKILYDYDRFEDVAAALQQAQLHVSDFEPMIAEAEVGDFIFVDPPYTVKHNNNGFLKYNEDIFSWDDQKRLAGAVSAAAARGAKVLVSNADHDSIRELYDGIGTLVQLDRFSVIGGSPDYRARTSELAIKVNY